jgi:Flp pilus assembly protein TadD
VSAALENSGSRQPERRAWALAAAIALLTAAIYAVVVDYSFVEYDDTLYVTHNERVQSGLSWQTFRWALTTDHDYNHIPLTWLSHLLDVEMYGLAPAGHHLTSVVFHVSNTLLLFAFFFAATGRLARSAFVSAVFALHPLHVESVAWVAERKDVLSTFFLFSALLAYLRFSRAPGAARMLLVTVLYALALAAKSMVMTLPFLLLLLDFWPLRRIPAGFWRGPGSWRERFARAELSARLIEKLPLFALTLGVVAITATAQSQAIVDLEHFPLSQRLAAIPTAYAMYLSKAFWPEGLSVLYAHPGRAISLPFGAAAGLGGVAATLFFLRAAGRLPWAPVGWFWFLGLLVPVIGIVQAGNQIIADRYSYVSLTGLSVLVAWGLPQLSGGSSLAARLRCVAGTVAVLGLAGATLAQLPVWRSTPALFSRVVALDDRNHVAHGILGLGLMLEDRHEEAFYHYTRAAQLMPKKHPLLLRLAQRLARRGELEFATEVVLRELEFAPGDTAARNELALLWVRRGELEIAARELRALLEHAPGNARAHGSLAQLDLSAGRSAAAREGYERAVAIRPDWADARLGLARSLARLGELESARQQAAEALRLAPADPEVRALVGALGAEP